MVFWNVIEALLRASRVSELKHTMRVLLTHPLSREGSQLRLQHRRYWEGARGLAELMIKAKKKLRMAVG